MRLPLEVAAFEPDADSDDAQEDLDLPGSREPEGDRGSDKE